MEVGINRPTLVPHDPRQPRVTPEDVDKRLNQVLTEEPATLEEEASLLERAHEILHNALQEG